MKKTMLCVFALASFLSFGIVSANAQEDVVSNKLNEISQKVDAGNKKLKDKMSQERAKQEAKNAEKQKKMDASKAKKEELKKNIEDRKANLKKAFDFSETK